MTKMEHVRVDIISLELGGAVKFLDFPDGKNVHDKKYGFEEGLEIFLETL